MIGTVTFMIEEDRKFENLSKTITSNICKEKDCMWLFFWYMKVNSQFITVRFPFIHIDFASFYLYVVYIFCRLLHFTKVSVFFGTIKDQVQ